MTSPLLEEAPRHRRGYLEARPGDVVGRPILIVDVRYEEDLLADFGHIHAVTHVPRARAEREGLVGVSRETPVVIVCGNGWESAKVAESLVRDHGYREVYHLVGGMLRWTAEERPVARTRTWRTLGS